MSIQTNDEILLLLDRLENETADRRELRALNSERKSSLPVESGMTWVEKGRI
jgi:hypothetical protein